jgi:hypothetical protein
VLERVEQEGRILGCPGCFYRLHAVLDGFIGPASPIERQGCASEAKGTNAAGTCDRLAIHLDGCRDVAI